MSHLSRPRIHFQGELFANVTTSNNDDVIQDLVDVASVTVRNPKEIFNQAIQERLDEEQKSGSLKAVSAAERTFQTNTIIDDEFRQLAGREDTGTIRAAGWNYCGDARCWFENVTVTGVELPGLPLITKKFNDSDPLIGAAVNLNEAIMVDVDPEGILSTQIFCHQFRISRGDSLLCEGTPAPFYARWHYSWRNLAFLGSFKGASAVWQAGIPGSTLCFGKTESDLLGPLKRAVEMQEWQGLFVRFCTYFFTRPDEPNNKGNYAAYGRVLGTIGPWYDDEMTSVTTGRLLYPVGRLSHNGRSFKLGPTVAKIDETDKQEPVVVLDLITTFPERDRTLEKIDCGEVLLQLQYSQQSRVHTETLGEPISYHRQAYEKRGGIVEVKCPQELKRFLSEGRLQLFFNEAGHHKLVEVDLAVETDERGIYLQKGDDKGKTIEFRVFRKGKPTNEAIAIKLEQYVTTNFKGNSPIPAEPAPSILHIVNMIPNGNIRIPNKEKPYEILVDPDGKACLTLKPKKAGTCIIRFVPTEQPGGQFNLTFGTSFFLNVRVLPEDNYENDERFEKGKKLEFKDIYNEILRYYHLLYPGVGHSFKFDNEEQVRDHAKEIIERISKDPHSAKYMPITRELSKGKRELLERWCAQVIEEEESGKYSSSAREV